MESSTSTLLLLLRPPPPPPPPPTPPWHFHFSSLLPNSSSSSTHSRFRFLRLRPIAARKFDFGPRSYDDDDDLGDLDARKRSKRRRRQRRSEQSRRWWFDEREGSELDERQPNSMLDQVIDSLWFLKVLKSYGWFSPFILLSILLATGPKAFLMAFSIPLALSLLALAFKKLFTWLEGTPEPKTRHKTKSPFPKARATSMEEADEVEEEEEESQPRRSQKTRVSSRPASNNGPVYRGYSSSKFGGWDELIREEVGTDRASRPDQKTNQTDRALKPDQITDEQDTPAQEAMSKMPVRERELPLLLKLLVALFPFLGSWISSF